MMKIIRIFILFFTLSLCSIGYAKQNGAWRDLDNIKTSPAYWTKDQCEKVVNKCDFALDIRRVKKGRVVDLSRPIFRASKDSPVLLDCENFDDCSPKAMNPDNDISTDDSVCLADNSQPKWDELVNHPGITGLTGPWFIWCEKDTGSFQKKDGFVPDIPGSIDADKEDLKKKEDNDKRNAAKVISETSLLQCFQDTKKPVMTALEQKNCFQALSAEVLGIKIPIEDL